MTSRERAVRAAKRLPVDRVPMDLTITIEAYNRLLPRLQGDYRQADNCSIFLVVDTQPDFLREMGVDFKYLTLQEASGRTPFQFGMPEYVNDFGLRYVRTRLRSGLTDYQPANAPMADLTAEDLERYPWPDPDDERRYAGLEETARRLYETSDLALVGNFGGSIFTMASLLRGMENFYVDLLTEPAFPAALLERLAAFYTRVNRNALEVCGRYLQFLRIDNDDFGSQNGPLISLETFRKTVKPPIARFYRETKAAFRADNPDGMLLKHCCGAVAAFIPDFIEMGVDMLDPVQYGAKGMEGDELRRRYGDRISFHGGIDTQSILPNGTPEAVGRHVREQIQKFRGDLTGYVPAPGHHIQGDVPPENILAMRDAVLHYSQ